MNTTVISRKIISNGVEVQVDKKKYPVIYPPEVWNSFPKVLQSLFADCIAYISTWQIPITHNSLVSYIFPHPFIEPYFFKLLTYSMPMTIFEYENISTQQILKLFYNSQFHTKFSSYKQPLIPHHEIKLKEIACVSFSFGKDSLLTYSLLNEMEVQAIPFFMDEPESTDEHTHKQKLRSQFKKDFHKQIEFFPLSFGELRQTTGYDWGWDAILSQYSFLLIPYFYHYKAKYLFFGNEQSCNFFTKDTDGYLINPVYEQSTNGMQLLQDLPRFFSLTTHIGSLIEPISELFITWILHKRYPEIGKYQMSCFSEDPKQSKKRWCGVCDKCSWVYIFLVALDINPVSVGFTDKEMLSDKKSNLYAIFNTGIGGSAYGGSGLAQDEQLLAFYLAYKRGVKGELINKFKKMYLKEVEKRKEELIKVYFGIHSSFSIPINLRSNTLHIYKNEQVKVMKYIQKLLK